MIRCLLLSYNLVLTPINIVASGCFAGADIITFFAPASICFLASFASLNIPEDSSTISIFKSFQGSIDGSFSEITFSGRPFITNALLSSPSSTVPSNELLDIQYYNMRSAPQYTAYALFKYRLYNSVNYDCCH